jgi:phosphatidylglycerophosphate synthase
MESDYGEYLDTVCDNIINLLAFIGITIGVARQNGLFASLLPFTLLLLGGILIFVFIYYPKGSGKGHSFKGTRMYDVILLLASRNFIYVIFLYISLCQFWPARLFSLCGRFWIKYIRYDLVPYQTLE